MSSDELGELVRLRAENARLQEVADATREVNRKLINAYVGAKDRFWPPELLRLRDALAALDKAGPRRENRD